MKKGKVATIASAAAKRLKEPSTHAGIMGALILAGQTVPEPTIALVCNTLAGIAAIVAMLTKEGKASESVRKA